MRYAIGALIGAYIAAVVSHAITEYRCAKAGGAVIERGVCLDRDLVTSRLRREE